jgi:GntR family transcriptional regulator/MocR family aminotransferase
VQFDEASWIAPTRAPGETLRAALERELRAAILDGSLRAGARLPSSRVLARTIGVSRGVTSDAYAQLEAQGFLSIAPRCAPMVAFVERGSSAPGERRPEPQPRFDFTPTTPDVTLFPRRLFARALADAARTATAVSLDYGDPAGLPELRLALADHLGLTRGVVTCPERIVVTQGTAQAVDLVLRVLRNRGVARVAIEDPSLVTQRHRVTSHGLEVIGQPVDARGLVVDGLRGDAAIVMPAHQFPTGTVLRGDRRRDLVHWARTGDRYLVEDDYDAEFRYDRVAVRALQGLEPARVVYVGTTSKTLAPGLRMGWIAAPPALFEELRETKNLLDAGSPALPQLALARLLRTGEYARHVRRARTIYRRRRDLLIHALETQLPGLAIEGVAAGVHLLLRLPAGISDTRAVEEARARGLRVEALSSHCIAPLATGGLVLGYGRLHEAAIPAAVRELAAVLHGQLPSGSRRTMPARSRGPVVGSLSRSR